MAVHDGCCGGPADAPADKAPVAPILVEVTRGGGVESHHRGHAVIADARGRRLAWWGDPETWVLPRSAVKPLQALPLVESGAFDGFGLTDIELALACASHDGEACHTGPVAAWLARLGAGEADLACGVQPPFDEGTAMALARSGTAPSALHNNCSGKHAGMLTTARFKGEPMQGYTRPQHPVQQRVLGVLEQMTGLDLGAAPRGVEACGIPTIAIPLDALAMAMARLGDPRGVPDHRAAAAARILGAWAAHPRLIAGRSSFDTRMMQALGGAALVKRGAEGVSCAVLPGLGLGIALKIEDGAARARDVAMAALLRWCGVLDGADGAVIDELCRPALFSRTGEPVGEVRPAAVLVQEG
ncbi:MAG: asparaginase [Azospirillum sp.]|nr:asparaginase [Azospirillum sp.]